MRLRRIAILAALALAGGCATGRFPVGAGADASAARSALQSAITASQAAIAHCQAALAAMPADAPDDDTPPDAGAICKLGTFRWTPGRGVTADPEGWRFTKRAEAVAYGAYNVQWLRADAILHAKFDAGRAQDGGAGTTWYTFSRGAGARPAAELAPYRWTGGTVATDATGTWTRWRRVP